MFGLELSYVLPLSSIRMYTSRIIDHTIRALYANGYVRFLFQSMGGARKVDAAEGRYICTGLDGDQMYYAVRIEQHKSPSSLWQEA